jgi:hypothetical protein
VWHLKHLSVLCGFHHEHDFVMHLFRVVWLPFCSFVGKKFIVRACTAEVMSAPSLAEADIMALTLVGSTSMSAM